MSDPVVIISRDWRNPKITVHVTHEGIKIAILLEDFLEGIALEVEPPMLCVTRAQKERLRDLVYRAGLAAFEKVKKTSTQT